MNYATIKTHDIANGTGVRVSLFVSGCTHHCKNCFNQELWDFNYGVPYTPETTENILEAMAPEYISGLSLLGGDPLEKSNQSTVLHLVQEAKRRFPEKDIWLYTGSLYEDIKNLEILKYIDVLIDGEFIEELKDITLQFRGSSNQRIIDVHKSMQNSKIVLLEIR